MRLCSLTQTRMKKTLLMLAMATACGSAMAQQLPNIGFDKWKSSCGVSYNPADNPKDRQRPGVEPEDWCGSNVAQLGVASTSTMCTSQKDGDNTYVELKNQKVGAFGITSVAPGFLSLAKPWVFATGTMTSDKAMALGDGGSYGSTAFSNRPDAIRLKYRHKAVSNEKAHIIAYLWNGTFVSQIPTNIKNSGSLFKPKWAVSAWENMEDVDRAVMGIENDSKVSSKGNLVASLDKIIDTDATDWTTLEIPFEYKSETEIPTKMNVILSAGDYWTRSNLKNESKLDVDDVEFVYYKTLSSLKVNGSDIALSDGVYTYDGTGAISSGCVEAKAKSPFANVSYKYNADNIIVTVTADNGETQNYQINFETAVTPPNATDIAGKYNNEIDVRLGDESADATYSFNEVTISANTDNTVNFILKGFSFMGIEIGNVNVENVPISWSGDNIALKCSKNIDIETTTPEAESMGLKNLPMTLAAEVNSDKELTAELQITWNSMPIYVSVVKQPFTYSITDGNLVVENGTIDDNSVMVLYGFASEKAATSINVSNASVTTTMLNDLADAMPNTIFYVGDNDFTGSNIVKNGSVESLNLTDGEAPFGIPQGFTANEVAYDRALTTGDYVSSFILPFAFDVPEGTTIAELSAVNGNTLVFKPVTRTEANKPYIIVTDDENVLSSFSNVTIEATDGSDLTTTVDGVKHIGSYTTKDVENVYGYANGKFVKANTGTVNPFRTYIEMPNTASAPKAFNISIEGTTTGINQVNTTNAATTSIYNLQGIRMSNDFNGLSKGVYIVNGKKVLK